MSQEVSMVEMQDQMNRLVAHVNAQKQFVDELTGSNIGLRAHTLMLESSINNINQQKEAVLKELNELKEKCLESENKKKARRKKKETSTQTDEPAVEDNEPVELDIAG